MIGLLGGTFDPIHNGHLDVARAARTALGLRELWLVPARRPPHRINPHASAAHRFAMIALALADEPGMMVSDLEMDTTGPSYTIETLDRLEERGVEGRDVCFVIGADAFAEITSWKGYPQLLDRCHFAVVSRPGLPVSELRTALPSLAPRMREVPGAIGPAPAIYLLDAPTAAVSSTEVRRAIADGRSIAALVPAAVAAYIARHGLYRTPVAEVPIPTP